MTTIYQEGNKLAPDDYIELFIFDATLIGGTTYYYTNTPTGSTNPIYWQGNAYYPFPFEVTGIENKGDGTSASRPSISMSNVNKFFMAGILQLGDLVGMKITRYRTFVKFADNGTEPNTNAHYPIDEWLVVRKMPSSLNTLLQFELCTPLDRPGLQLPRRKILRDLGFPGVSRTRVR